MLDFFLSFHVWLQYSLVALFFAASLSICRWLARKLHELTVKLEHFVISPWIGLLEKFHFFFSFYFMLMSLILAASAPVILQELRLEHQLLNSLTSRILWAFALFTVCITLSSAVSVISARFERNIRLPVKGLSQAVKIIIWIVTGILALSALLNKDPAYLIGGLTALSAVLLLVFQSSILGLVSGFQLVLNDLVRVGDWIVMPGQNADGEITDILLTTVRVRNWDNTVVNIPANTFISNSFANWREMSDSGGRRIKRAINIDMKTVRFLDNDDIERLKKIRLLQNYLKKKQEELREANRNADQFNITRITNLGTFRQYILEYLHENEFVSNKFTCMVRQLAPTPEGLPMEIYCFCADTRWVNYENVQSDIFDHLLAIISEFDLKVFQRIGND
ncbi:MAG: mechanosensitive ion channel family protein [Elusimicrobiales bacterium]|nr:mechanosensitive ion channel family protein [Elusimicrobiales bacterium]